MTDRTLVKTVPTWWKHFHDSYKATQGFHFFFNQLWCILVFLKRIYFVHVLKFISMKLTIIFPHYLFNLCCGCKGTLFPLLTFSFLIRKSLQRTNFWAVSLLGLFFFLNNYRFYYYLYLLFPSSVLFELILLNFSNVLSWVLIGFQSFISSLI